MLYFIFYFIGIAIFLEPDCQPEAVAMFVYEEQKKSKFCISENNEDIQSNLFNMLSCYFKTVRAKFQSSFRNKKRLKERCRAKK